MDDRAETFFESFVRPVIEGDASGDQWCAHEIDELITLLVKFRASQHRVVVPSEALIGAGLVTGFLRENPLLSQHNKVDPPPNESGPKELFKYRKDLINSAMGSYCGGHTRRGHNSKKMATKYVRDGMNGSSGRESIPDPVATFNEDQLYKHRAALITAMLDSVDFGADIRTQMVTRRDQRDAQVSGPDGVNPTFMRHYASIRSPITGDSVVFY